MEELDKLQKDISVNFLMWVESEYYLDCGSWHNKETQDYCHNQDLYDEFIKQYQDGKFR